MALAYDLSELVARATVGRHEPPERYILLDSGVTDPLEARVADW